MAGEDPAYTAWLRTLPCRVHGCHRTPEVHHVRHHTGAGLRPHDNQGIPLCHRHHMALHAAAWPFSLAKAKLKAWQHAQVAELRAVWESDDAF